jgi:hypothetical protein
MSDRDATPARALEPIDNNREIPAEENGGSYGSSKARGSREKLKTLSNSVGSGINSFSKDLPKPGFAKDPVSQVRKPRGYAHHLRIPLLLKEASYRPLYHFSSPSPNSSPD